MSPTLVRLAHPSLSATLEGGFVSSNSIAFDPSIWFTDVTFAGAAEVSEDVSDRFSGLPESPKKFSDILVEAGPRFTTAKLVSQLPPDVRWASDPPFITTCVVVAVRG